MKLIIFGVVMSLVAGQVIASAKKTNDQLYKDKTIMSLNSNKCHSVDSPSFNLLNVVLNDEGSPVNVYDNIDQCIANGGKLTDSAKAKIVKNAGPEALVEKIESEKAASKKQEEVNNFYGINWGLGLAYTWVNESDIEDVSIVNGTVRVNKKTKNRAIAMLESHYFFRQERVRREGSKDITTTYGHGPFMSVGVAGQGDVDPLTTYGAGWMWGAKIDDQGTSWNIGLGIFMNTEVATLRGGFTDGGATTETDPNKLLTVSDVTGLMMMFSATF